MSAATAEAPDRASPTPGAGSWRVLDVAIAVDIATAVAKFFVAALTGSSAMLTEGVHSLVDIGNQLLLLRWQARPARVGRAAFPWARSSPPTRPSNVSDTC